VTAVHDRHVEGLFSRAVWNRVLASAGYGPIEAVARPIGEGRFDQIFAARRP
jgi:hypothetical protein